MNAVPRQTAARKCEHDAVERELDPVRLPDVGHGGIEEPDADDRQPEPEHAAEEREQYALDEELPHDTEARGAERDTDRDFARSTRRSREE